MTMLKTCKGDITTAPDIMNQKKVSAIVNAANNSLLGGTGVDGTIHTAAGTKLLEECKTLQGCEKGKAKITQAYDIPCHYIVHTVGPVWNGGESNEDEALAGCYYNSLQLAMTKDIKLIAFPSISTGDYGFPVQRAARIAMDTVQRFLKENPGSFDLIEWVLQDDKTARIYEMEADRVYDELSK